MRFLFADALGLEGILLGSVLRFFSTTDISLSKAKSLFLFCERYCATTILTLGPRRLSNSFLLDSDREALSEIFQTSSTRVFTLLECCPPGPPDLVYRNEISF